MRRTEFLPSWSGVVPRVREQLDPILDDYESAWLSQGQPDHNAYLQRCETDTDARKILAQELNHLDAFFAEHDSEPKSLAAPAQMPQTIGDYNIIRRVGSGGFGVVFLGFDALHNRRVAIKVARPAWLVDKDAQELATEANILSGFDHPHIVHFFESGVFGHNEWYVVTEWIDGVTLSELLQEGLLHPRQAIEIALQIADGMCYAHDRNVAHLDIKPRNVMIDLGGNVKLLDFGTAKILDAISENSFTGQITGSFHYMAPEQKRGEYRQIDAQSDIYATGMLLHEMLVGKCDQQDCDREPMSLCRVNPRIPTALDQICSKALQQNKKRRYTSMNAMRADLRRCLDEIDDSPITDYQAITLRHARKQSAMKRRRAALVGLPAIALALLFLFFAIPRGTGVGAASAAPDGERLFSDDTADVAVWVKSNPDGARVYFYELDAAGEPILESEVYAGRGPASIELPPGDYYVSAILDNGDFTETFRAVPWPDEMRGFNKSNAWRQTELGYQLPSINIHPANTEGMVLVGSFWIDQHLVGANEIPKHKFEFGPGQSVDGVRTKIRHAAAAEYLESMGKRLPFRSELQQASQASVLAPSQLDEWTHSLDWVQSITADRDGARRRVSHYQIQSDAHRQSTGPEFASYPTVGFRGVRSNLPLRER